ncbi:hypothetical protein [Clostridium fallax]|uniref:Uncharacterized protein n=1 Tax=Clostridium fallax TaxID=1533 RepID=A0A1M4ULW5_9CLOT|nr:hypothetical protein [Clostridium fallax]SHE57647.1 hypothetical protein SAMN05443638_10588 [Clostridium fallax]SQB07634.1 Uncharacterised protein [Clostridium fallax]
MEFRLNKIDMDLRQKIQDETSEGKIHRKKEILIENTDYKEKKEKNKKNNKEKENKDFKDIVKKSKKITIDTVKFKSYKVDAEKDISLNKSKSNIGVFLDTKK